MVAGEMVQGHASYANTCRNLLTGTGTPLTPLEVRWARPPHERDPLDRRVVSAVLG